MIWPIFYAILGLGGGTSGIVWAAGRRKTPKKRPPKRKPSKKGRRR